MLLVLWHVAAVRVTGKLRQIRSTCDLLSEELFLCEGFIGRTGPRAARSTSKMKEESHEDVY